MLMPADAALVSAAEKFKYDSKDNRDPFISLVTPEGRILPGARANSEPENIILEGVIWDPNGNSLAIINGKLIKEKERVYGMQLLKINKESVIMQKKGNVKVIYLKRKGGGADEKRD